MKARGMSDQDIQLDGPVSNLFKFIASLFKLKLLSFKAVGEMMKICQSNQPDEPKITNPV